MTIFDSLLDQWGGRAAFPTALGERRLHGRLPTEALDSLISWEGVAELLINNRLNPPHVKVVQTAGRPVSPSRYFDRTSSPRRKDAPIVDLARLREILRGGATLMIDNIDEMLPRIGRTAWELSAVVGELVQTHLYATAGDVPAFAPHWDVVDVLVVQVEGSKHWDVYGPGTLNPIDALTDPDNTRPDDPEWSGVLVPGDVLYLPRGWWHGVCGTGGTSLHLSYGFQSQTGLAYLRWLSTLARHAAPFRVDIPKSTDDQDVKRHEKVLIECFNQLVQDHPLRDYLATHAEMLVPPAAPRLDELV
jgi:hypothetical protein